LLCLTWRIRGYNANMGKLKALLNAFIDWFTMKNARHNRALRDLLYLLKSIEDFLARYRLREDGSDFNTAFKNMGQLRIDAVEIAYQTGIRIRRAKNIKGKDLPPLVEEVYNDLEELKRALFTRTLSNTVLSEHVSKLDVAFKNLLAAMPSKGYE